MAADVEDAYTGMEPIVLLEAGLNQRLNPRQDDGDNNMIIINKPGLLVH